MVKRNEIHIPDSLIGKRIRVVLDGEEDKWVTKVKQLQKEIDDLRTELEKAKRGKIYYED